MYNEHKRCTNVNSYSSYSIVIVLLSVLSSSLELSSEEEVVTIVEIALETESAAWDRVSSLKQSQQLGAESAA